MFENIMKFFNKFNKKQDTKSVNSRETAKERLHLVLMQDRANVSADFLDLMKQEIIEVIKKYIDVDENAIDVRLTNKANSDGTNGAPALYANIPIVSIKEEVKSGMARQEENKEVKKPENNEKVEKNRKNKKIEESKKNEKVEKNRKEEDNKEGNNINDSEQEESIKAKEKIKQTEGE